MTVFQPEPVDTHEIETMSVEDYNRIVQEYREKDEFYLVSDQRRINGKIKISEIEPLGTIPISNDRRERVYDATNRILEHAQGTNDEAFHKVEDAVDSILSTIGVPDRVIQE